MSPKECSYQCRKSNEIRLQYRNASLHITLLLVVVALRGIILLMLLLIGATWVLRRGVGCPMLL